MIGKRNITITEAAEYRREVVYFDIHSSGSDVDELPTIYEPNNELRGLMISVNGNASYYFSPQLRAGLNLGFQWSDDYRFSDGHPPWQGNYNYSTSYTLHASKYLREFDYSIGPVPVSFLLSE